MYFQVPYLSTLRYYRVFRVLSLFRGSSQILKTSFCKPLKLIENLRNLHLSLIYILDRFTKTFFWNFQKSRADLCYIFIYKQMLEKVFCSNSAPSLSSGNHLFYKAEYMGQSCPNQVWAITFDWSALAT